MLNWTPGRQGSGYEKIRIFQSARLKCDLYLLRYREGSFIAAHTDLVPGFRHVRVNLIVWPAQHGGHFWADALIVDWPMLKIFYSDHQHGVTHVRRGTRYVLSFGFLRKET